MAMEFEQGRQPRQPPVRISIPPIRDAGRGAEGKSRRRHLFSSCRHTGTATVSPKSGLPTASIQF